MGRKSYLKGWRRSVMWRSALQRDVLIGRGPRVSRDQAEGRLSDPLSDTAQSGQLPDRRGDHPLMHELLDFLQQRLALLMVEFGRLLLKQRIDIGIAVIGVGTTLHRERLEAGRGVAERGAAAHDQILELFLAVAFVERR